MEAECFFDECGGVRERGGEDMLGLAGAGEYVKGAKGGGRAEDRIVLGAEFGEVDSVARGARGFGELVTYPLNHGRGRVLTCVF